MVAILVSVLFDFDMARDRNTWDAFGSHNSQSTWWRHQMETFSALLALLAVKIK